MKKKNKKKKSNIAIGFDLGTSSLAAAEHTPMCIRPMLSRVGVGSWVPTIISIISGTTSVGPSPFRPGTDRRQLHACSPAFFRLARIGDTY